MLETYTRPHVQKHLNRIASLLKILRLTPLRITILAFFAGVFSSFCLAHRQVIPALALMWLSGLLDSLDGSLARLLNNQNPWGAYNDLISDRMVESGLMVGFLVWQPQHSLAYLIFMVALLFHFSTFLAAGSLFKNSGPKSMHYDVSIVERAEAFIIFSLMMLFPDRIGPLLTGLNCVIFLSGCARYFRVWQHTK